MSAQHDVAVCYDELGARGPMTAEAINAELARDAQDAIWRFGGPMSSLAGQLAAGVPVGTDVWTFDPHHTSTLLVHHPRRGWVMPGGHVEPGETVRAAAARELAEETGIVVSADRLQPVAVHVGPDAVGLSYALHLDPETPVVGEPGAPVRWWSLAETWESNYPHDAMRLRRHVAWTQFTAGGATPVWTAVSSAREVAHAVLRVEAPEVLAVIERDADWQQVELHIDELSVDEEMVVRHDAADLHCARRDGFVDVILARQELTPLLVIGEDDRLVDGYGRLRALRCVRVDRVQVLRPAR